MPGIDLKESEATSQDDSEVSSPAIRGSQRLRSSRSASPASAVSDILDTPSQSFSSDVGRSSLELSSSPANTSTIQRKKKGNDTPNQRRASSRVRSKPEYFSPIVASGGSSNRSDFSSPIPQLKSPSLDTSELSVDQSVDEEENNTIVQDDEEDDEVVFKKPPVPRARKSKPKLHVTVKKKTPGRKRSMTVNMPKDLEDSAGDDDEDQEEMDEANLFSIVKQGKSAMLSVLDDWIESYNKNKSHAMVDLIQFFIHSCGCKAKVTKAMIDAEDTVQAIRHLTTNFGEQAAEYPLIVNKPAYKKFKESFSKFILQLINQCQHSIIYDENMMDIMISWIIGLSDSQVRAFRHTSTLAGMKIVSGLIDVALKVGVEQDVTQRQLDAENLKLVAKRSREKVETLQKKRSELRGYVSDLQEMMSRIFMGIFVHRYRDVRPEIRSICIGEIGAWMRKYSTHFLDQNYLKYLGWMLYDKNADVRLEVLKALAELYKDETFVEQLDLFTSRFKARIVNMTLDVETEVAVQAIKVVSLLYKYDVLEEEECGAVEQLVFCDQRQTAHATGEFLALRIIRLSIEASPKKMKQGTKEDYLKQMNIKAILDFFIKTEIHEHCAYLVDSLWEHTNLLKDWQTMTNMLLDINAYIDLDDQEELALIDLMTCSCKMAATGTGPPGRVVHKKQSMKERRILVEDRHNISAHFMEYLPALLDKYQADVPKVTLMLNIPQYFELEVYAEKRLTKHLESLLGHMEDIVLKHADTELLQTCSKTYHYLIDNEVVIKQTVEVGRNKLIDEVVERYRKCIADGIPTDEEDKNTQSYFNIVTNLKKLTAFYKSHDLGDWDLYQDFNATINQAMNGSVDDEVLILTLHSMWMLLLMNMMSLNPDEPDKDDLRLLRKRLRTFIKQCDELLQFSNLGVKTEVFKTLCDVFVYFARQMLNKAPLLAPIVCEADPALQVRMRDFVITHVLDHTDEIDELNEEEEDFKAQELFNKRVLLAGLCKLIAFNMFDMRLAAPIFAQFLKGFSSFSDIIKMLMQKTKEINMIAFTKTLLHGLQQAYENLRDECEGVIDVTSKEFQDIKDLAHRFALSLGVNLHHENTRKSGIILHREGINYAFEIPMDPSQPTTEQIVPDVPPNLLFLEILHEFTYRLLKVDRKPVFSHLEQTAGDLLSKRGKEWGPIRTYRNGLISSGNESRGTFDETAEDELEAALVMEKSVRTKAAPARRGKRPTAERMATAAQGGNIKKKLSLTRIGGTDEWLSKEIIERHQNENAPPPKAAGSIPKVKKPAQKSPKKSPLKRGRPSSNSSSSYDAHFEVVSSVAATAAPSPKKSKSATPQKSPQKQSKKGDPATPKKGSTTPKKSSTLLSKNTKASPKASPKKAKSVNSPAKSLLKSKSPVKSPSKSPGRKPLATKAAASLAKAKKSLSPKKTPVKASKPVTPLKRGSASKSPSKRKTDSPAKSSPTKVKKRTPKKSATATSPLKLTISTSPKKNGDPIAVVTKSTVTPEKKSRRTKDDEESTSNSSVQSSRASSVSGSLDSNTKDTASPSTQRSWLASQKNEKTTRKSYGNNSRTPTKRTRSRATDEELESSLDISQSSQSSEANQSGGRATRRGSAPVFRSKRQKRDIPTNLFEDSQDSQTSSAELPGPF